MVIENLRDLKQFMLINCYNMNLYGLGESPKQDGFGIEKWGELYTWYYTERGNKEIINYFQTETEVVKFAFDIISKDKFARSHFLASFEDLSIKNELTELLQDRKIEFWSDEIPYLGKNNKLIRFFVVGCDIEKVVDLKAKYNFLKD